MGKLNYILFGIVLMSLMFVSAENPCGNPNHEYMGTFKQFSNVTLKGTCDGCTYVYLTSMTYPNGYSENFNLTTTLSGGTFTRNEFLNTSQNGCYTFNILGDTTPTTSSIDFKITPSGVENTVSFYLIFLLIVALVLALGFYIEDPIIIVLGSFSQLFFGFLIIRNGIDIIKDPLMTWAIGLLVWGLAIYFLFRGIEELNDYWN